MIDDLVTKVITVEDIPADVATELVILFNMVVKRTPQIFPVSIMNITRYKDTKKIYTRKKRKIFKSV